MTKDNPLDEHLAVTPPDRYHGEGYKVLWIDWEWDQIDTGVSMLQGSPEKLIIHMFGHNDTDFRWLLDIAYQADIIMMNLSHQTAADTIKGHLIGLDKTRYFGRRDLETIFPGYIEEPHGAMLTWVAQQIDKRKQ